MTKLPDHFFIKYGEKKVMVSILTNASGNYFTVHLEEGNINLKSAGLKTLLWLERGKGATGLAYQLGQLIEQHLVCAQKQDN
jgi:hypothetical protein